MSALLLAVSADAATLTVNSTADAGGTCPGPTCTLRQAIATAGSGDTINFNISTSDPGFDAQTGRFTITLTSSKLVIQKNLTINGPSANLLSVQRSTAAGTPAFQIFHILGNFNVTFSGLTIANGSAPGFGGGIDNELGTVTITKSTISGNSASNSGGGISNDSGAVTIINSTVSSNSTNGRGPGNGGGGIYSNGTLTITNSTISGNSAGNNSSGGGIYNTGGGTLTITNSTLSANSSGLFGGGIQNLGGPVNARNTIIAKNTATSDGPDFSGTLTSQGFNLMGNTGGTTITGTTTGNQLNVDPLLDTLKDNGGPTFTHALLSGSPAIEGGNSSGSNTDQRGFARPVDSPVIANASGGDGSDIGAYEVQADVLPGCNTINRIVKNNDDSGTDSLRAVIANVCAGSTITFAANVRGALNLTSGELLINKSLTISGPGANLLNVQRSAASGTPGFRIFNTNFLNNNVVISGLTIADGSAPGANGGAIYNGGTLTINYCTISGNSASSSSGGGIYNTGGTLTIANSTISGNMTGSGGGIYNVNNTDNMTSGTLAIINSTISGNSAASAGGGISSLGTVTITNSTISGNSAGSGTGGGGIFNGGGTFAPVSMRNTIVALNTSASGPDVNGVFTSQGFNLIGNSSGATIASAQFSDQIGTSGSPIDPMLGSLQNNGGPTQTVALLSTSPAINGGDPNAPPRDQRDYIRPNAPDIGAFEFGGIIPVSLGNISSRGLVGTGDDVMIGGFVVGGSGNKTVLLRAIGPSLGNPPFNLANTLQDPTISLFNSSGGMIISNDNWSDASNAQSIAPGLRPSNGAESAILISLAPGAYTAIVRGANAGTGIGLVEVFDLDPTAPSTLSNISTRGLVETGDDVMIGGFFVKGPDSDKVVVRAIGPSLASPPFNLSNALQNPTLTLFDGNGNAFASNDDWRSTQETEIIATGLQPSNDSESAIVVTLIPGNYTAIVRGANGTTGIALVEVYGLN